MSDKKTAGKSKGLKSIFAKRGYTVMIVLAALILIVSIVTLSYSWYSPLTQPGTSMSYSATVKVRSENCSIIGTFPAESENVLPMSLKTGNLEASYVQTAAENATVQLATMPQDAPAGTVPDSSTTGQIFYFRTKIQNNDTQPTNVSLYLKTAPSLIGDVAPGSSFSKIGIGVVSPSNSYNTFTTPQTDFCIIRNAFIRGCNDEKYQTLYVDWFVRTYSDSAVKIDFGDLYIRYN